MLFSNLYLKDHPTISKHKKILQFRKSLFSLHFDSQNFVTVLIISSERLTTYSGHITNKLICFKLYEDAFGMFGLEFLLFYTIIEYVKSKCIQKIHIIFSGLIRILVLVFQCFRYYLYLQKNSFWLGLRTSLYVYIWVNKINRY